MRYGITLILLLAVSSAFAARHSQIEIETSETNHLAVDSLTGSEYLLGGVTDDNALVFQQVRFSNSQWRALQEKKIPLDRDGEWRVHSIKALPPGQGAFILMEAIDCDVEGECVVAQRELGKVSANFSDYEKWSTLPICDGKPVINTNLSWPAVMDGCGAISLYSEPNVIISDATLPSLPDDAIALPLIVGGEVGEVRFGVLMSGTYTSYSLRLNNEQSALIWEQESTLFEVPDGQCELTGNDNYPLWCITETRTVYLFADDGSIKQSDYFEGSSSELDLGFAHNGRAFVWEKSEVNDEDGDLGATLAVNNIDVSSGELNSHSIDGRTNVEMSTLSSDANHAASLLSNEEGQFTLSIYSQLDVNHPPLFNQLSGVAVATEMSESLTLDVRDEESVSQDLVITAEDALPFVVFDDESRMLTLSPKHSDAGQYAVAVEAIDPQGNAQAVSLPLNVVLTPYVWQVFEPTLFEQIEVEDPVSVMALFASLGRWPLLEDDSVVITFTWLNRESDDVRVVFDNLPDFFVYDDDSDTLTASPLQEHVGQHVLNARLFDRFDSEQPQEEVRLTFNVLEVDDPLVVTSDGSERINVGELYSYTLTVEDEETALSQMRIDVLEAPDFVTFDRESATLSGTPSQDDVGPNEVQMLITDRGGNRVLHKFEVSVISTDNDVESNGGATSVWSMLTLLCFTAIRKRKRRA